MKEYLDLCQYVLEHGTHRNDRTGTGTIGCFGYQTRYDLSRGFPLLTTKKVHFKSVVYELLWFIQGNTNIEYLVQHGVRIWNEWPYDQYRSSDAYAGESLSEFAHKIATDHAFALAHGDLGPVYGKQWRNFSGVDQLSQVIDLIRNHPESRRILMSAWNPAELDQMALPACHAFVQFYVQDGALSCLMYQRSADVFLGVPFNIASYALLTEMLAQVCGLKAGEMVHTFGDVHIYQDHLAQVHEQLSRAPRNLPKLKLNPEIRNIEDFRYEDISLLDYDPWPVIAAKVSV